jgi:carboxypeptidase C (cathepsin A)
LFRLNLASESYGGHYAPGFVTYFNEQNDKIDKGIVKGDKIVITTLLINK